MEKLEEREANKLAAKQEQFSDWRKEVSNTSKALDKFRNKQAASDIRLSQQKAASEKADSYKTASTEGIKDIHIVIREAKKDQSLVQPPKVKLTRIESNSLSEASSQYERK